MVDQIAVTEPFVRRKRWSILGHGEDRGAVRPDGPARSFHAISRALALSHAEENRGYSPWPPHTRRHASRNGRSTDEASRKRPQYTKR